MNGGQNFVSNSILDNQIVNGILVNQSAGGNYFTDLAMNCGPSGGEASNLFQGSIGIRINQGDGHHLSNINVSGYGKAALYLFPRSTTVPLAAPENNNTINNVFCSNTQFDLAGFGNSAVINGGLATTHPASGTPVPLGVNAVTWVTFANCTFTAAAQSGLTLINCSHVTITGCKAFVNRQDGIYLGTGTSGSTPVVHQVNISGGEYFSNSYNNGSSFSGIYVDGRTLDVSVVGTSVGKDPSNSLDTQQYGIVLAPGANQYCVTGCSVHGYGGAGIFEPSPGSVRLVTNNLT